MSRPRKGGRRAAPKEPLSPEDQKALDMLGPERASDREALAMFRGKVRMRTRDQTREVTVSEALNHKMLEAAMAGNSHAGWLMMEQREKAEEAERARKLDDLALWLWVKQRNRDRINAALARGEPEPVVYPHPDDIVVNDDKEVVILGPCDEAQHAEMLEDRRTRDACLVQFAIERVLAGRRWLEEEDRRDPVFRLFRLYNDKLPPRLRWGPRELADELKVLFALTKRVLLKRTRREMAAIGWNLQRGQRLDKDGLIGRTLDACRDVCDVLEANRQMPAEEIGRRVIEMFRGLGFGMKGDPPVYS